MKMKMKINDPVYYLSPDSAYDLTATSWRYPRLSPSLSPVAASSTNSTSEPGSPMNSSGFSQLGADYYRPGPGTEVENVKMEYGFEHTSDRNDVYTSQRQHASSQWGGPTNVNYDMYHNQSGDGQRSFGVPALAIDINLLPPNEPLSALTSTTNSTTASSSSEYNVSTWGSYSDPQQFDNQQLFSKDIHGRKRSCSSGDAYRHLHTVDPTLLTSTYGGRRTDSLDLAVQSSQHATQLWTDEVPSARSPSMSNFRSTVASPAVKHAAVKKRKGTQPLHFCDFCGEGLTTRQNLKYHIDAHAGIRPFLCQFCAKTFGTPHVCKRHETRCPNKL